MRRYLAVSVAAALLGAGVAAAPPPPDEAAIVHLLNRVGFGPAPLDVEAVRRVGPDRYIEQQLHPERLDDAIVGEKLAGLRTLSLSTRELLALAPRPGGRGQPRPQPTRDERQAANRPLGELSQQKLLRAIYSERQLEEVLVDFWFNHFNVDARKGPVRFMAIEYERDAIRPYVLGRFRDLLGATAKSPAMLFYLDNWQSAAPNLRRGLNENYARELMELHTLGADGGYTQKDVTEVARAFTGWTIENPRAVGTFRFDPRRHDRGEKVVLGHRLDGGGIKDGEQVLDILAAHPSTARFISTKLARRFVSDTPPPALVDRLAARFTATGGDLREVMRTLLRSAEFRSPGTYAAKTKTPFEFVVSAVRVAGVERSDARPLVRALQQLGMPLYQCQPPTGYKDTADAWVNTGALVNRMNFAITLAAGAAPDLKGGAATPSTIAIEILRGLSVSDATRDTIAKATTPAQAIALALGSPEFQRR